MCVGRLDTERMLKVQTRHLNLVQHVMTGHKRQTHHVHCHQTVTRKATWSESWKAHDTDSTPKPAMLCMARLFTSFKSLQLPVTDFKNVGPLVDDGAPFNAIGEMEVHLIFNDLNNMPVLEPKPDQLAAFDTRQYVTGTHSSQQIAIVCYVEQYARDDDDQLLPISHLVISGSSGWVIGGNVICHCETEQSVVILW